MIAMLFVAFTADPPSAPPLLSVPPMMAPSVMVGPRGPSGEYDSGYLYLPERAPDGPRKPARKFRLLPQTPLFPDRPRLIFR